MFLGMLGSIQILIVVAVAFIVLGFQIYALVDAIRSDFKGKNDKLIWILVILFLGLIGSIVYFIVGKEQKVFKTES